MRNIVKLSITVVSVVLLVVTWVEVAPAQTSVVSPDATTQHAQMQQMQARMQAMHAQMTELQKTTDPAKRQQLLAEHMLLMQEQMKAMRTMGGEMMMSTMGSDFRMGTGPGMHGNAPMGQGMQQGAMGSSKTTPDSPGPRHQMMQDRVDMLQMMMEQMMGQMQMQSEMNGPSD